MTPRRLPLRLTSHPQSVRGLAVAGLAATFVAMIATGDAGHLGAIALAPWTGLLGLELGVVGGTAVGVVATGLYSGAAEIAGGPTGPLELSVRLVALVAVGAAAGAAGGRVASSERAYRAVASLQTALLDSTLDGICLTDARGNALLSNAPLRRISVEMGLPPTGTVPERLLAIADRTTEPQRYRERMLALAREPDVVSVDEFELKDSGRVFRGYTAPVASVEGGAGGGRIWTLREVTADRELERLRDAFVAAVSHELRTPLTSISGFLEMLADEEHELGETGRGYLGIIRRSTARLLRIVEDLLLVAQIEADRLELQLGPADLREIAAATVEAAGPAAEDKGVALELLPGGPCPLEGDAHRLGQVLDNLVANAIKFTDAGGAVQVAVVHDGAWARATVSDTGVGIPTDEQGQLFSRFFRASTATRRAVPGTGLGLVIARAIVEGHGGGIALESVEGEGTRVTVALPGQSGGA
ncbi:MAG TPA: ATP-binding protein [Gaiellaceae bacterium]|nr:ATP-binding protein [Gaiellaceae bacterium]